MRIGHIKYMAQKTLSLSACQRESGKRGVGFEACSKHEKPPLSGRLIAKKRSGPEKERLGRCVFQPVVLHDAVLTGAFEDFLLDHHVLPRIPESHKNGG